MSADDPTHHTAEALYAATRAHAEAIVAACADRAPALPWAVDRTGQHAQADLPCSITISVTRDRSSSLNEWHWRVELSWFNGAFLNTEKRQHKSHAGRTLVEALARAAQTAAGRGGWATEGWAVLLRGLAPAARAHGPLAVQACDKRPHYRTCDRCAPWLRLADALDCIPPDAPPARRQCTGPLDVVRWRVEAAP